MASSRQTMQANTYSRGATMTDAWDQYAVTVQPCPDIVFHYLIQRLIRDRMTIELKQLEPKQVAEILCNAYLVQKTNARGTTMYKVRCETCSKQLDSGIPHRKAELLKRAGCRVATVRGAPPTSYSRCSYRGCEDAGIDNHHFAPRNVFGKIADNYPVMPLCREHHTYWHSRMNGYHTR
jgi:hypothetical protein